MNAFIDLSKMNRRRYNPTMKPPHFSTTCGFLVQNVRLFKFNQTVFFGGYCYKQHPCGHGVIGYCTWHTNGQVMDKACPDLKICEHLKEMLK